MLGCTIGDRRSELFEDKGKDVSSKIIGSGYQDDITRTLLKCKEMMSKYAEEVKKKRDIEGFSDQRDFNVGGKDKAGGKSQSKDGDPMLASQLEHEGHARNINHVITERLDFISKSRFLDRGDDIRNSFEYFSDVISKVSHYTLDNYWNYRIQGYE